MTSLQKRISKLKENDTVLPLILLGCVLLQRVFKIPLASVDPIPLRLVKRLIIDNKKLYSGIVGLA